MNLDLVLKFHWFDEIEAGRKDIEYREIRPYWTVRIWERRDKIKTVTFRRAYTLKKLTRNVEKIDIGPCPYEGWDGEYYRIYFTPGWQEPTKPDFNVAVQRRRNEVIWSADGMPSAGTAGCRNNLIEVSMEKKIPIEFYNEKKAGQGHPIVHTVGELIAQLQRLPADLPVSGGFGNPAQLVVYNIGHDPFLEINEFDED